MGFSIFIFYLVSFLCVCLEPAVRKNSWMRTFSVTGMVIFSRVLTGKLLNHSYVPSFFSTITVTFTMAFERQFTAVSFTEMDKNAC